MMNDDDDVERSAAHQKIERVGRSVRFALRCHHCAQTRLQIQPTHDNAPNGTALLFVRRFLSLSQVGGSIEEAAEGDPTVGLPRVPIARFVKTNATI